MNRGLRAYWGVVCVSAALWAGCGEAPEPVVEGLVEPDGAEQGVAGQRDGVDAQERLMDREPGARQEEPDAEPDAEPGVLGELEPFVPAPVGCSQAHCDAELSDQARLPAPVEGVRVLRRDSDAAGSNYALGCSSNGERVACAYGGVADRGPYLVVYGADGERLWANEDMKLSTFTSAPAVEEAGGVIAADGEKVVRFDPEGGELWRFGLPEGSGAPISPVITSRGLATFATTEGLIGSIDTRTGAGHTLRLEASLVGERGVAVPGAFVTRNTPTARRLEQGDRIYVTTEFKPDSEVTARAACLGAPARFYALDVGSSGALSVAWFVDVGGRAGASPTVSGDVLFFDADRLDAFGPASSGLRDRCQGQDAPHFFAVRDLGPRGEFVYKHPLTSMELPPSGEGGGLASAARDPEGGLWLFALGSGALVRLSETPSAQDTTYDGSPAAEVLEVLDFSARFPEAQPSSAITIAQGARGPVGMMTLMGPREGADFETRWLAFDLRPGEGGELVLRGELVLGEGYDHWSAAQSPVALDAQGRPRVFLSTFSQGMVVIGAP